MYYSKYPSAILEAVLFGCYLNSFLYLYLQGSDSSVTVNILLSSLELFWSIAISIVICIYIYRYLIALWLHLYSILYAVLIDHWIEPESCPLLVTLSISTTQTGYSLSPPTLHSAYRTSLDACICT